APDPVCAVPPAQGSGAAPGYAAVPAQDPTGAVHQRRPEAAAAGRQCAAADPPGGTGSATTRWGPGWTTAHGHRVPQLFPVADADYRPIPQCLAGGGGGFCLRALLRPPARAGPR